MWKEGVIGIPSKNSGYRSVKYWVKQFDEPSEEYGINGGKISKLALTTAQMPSHSHGVGTLATNSTGSHTHNLKNQKTTWGASSGNKVLIDATSGYTAVTNKATTSAGAHTHTISGSTASAGSGSAHSNLQPYITCYMWKRTA